MPPPQAGGPRGGMRSGGMSVAGSQRTGRSMREKKVLLKVIILGDSG